MDGKGKQQILTQRTAFQFQIPENVSKIGKVINYQGKMFNDCSMSYFF